MSGYLAEIFNRYGTEMWCDSANPTDLGRMIELGACGATSNPVLIPRAVAANVDRWRAEIPACKAEGRLANWNLYRRVARVAAEALLPVYKATGGQRGLLSVQVDPRNWNDTAAMLVQAREASAIAPNVSVKVPATKAGILTSEELAAEGISTTVTVSYTLPQVVAIAEAFKRGKARAAAAGKIRPDRPLHSYAVLMVGRLDDHLRDLVKEQGLDVKPELLTYAGNAVAKKAYKLFQERGYESLLLIAAMRGNYHVDQYIGGKLVLTLPPANEVEFGKAVGQQAPEPKIDEQVPSAVIDELSERFADFRRAYAEDGMTAEEFASFGSSVKTLKQFSDSWESFIEFVNA